MTLLRDNPQHEPVEKPAETGTRLIHNYFNEPERERHTWFSPQRNPFSAAVLIVMTLCTTVIAIFAASASAATFVATGMTLGVALPPIVRAAILWRMANRATGEAQGRSADHAIEMARIIDEPHNARRRRHQMT